MEKYYFEITDTFGGETNYSWVKRVCVEAKSLRGALIKLSKHSGYHWRLSGDDQWDAKGASVRAFEIYDEHSILHYEWETA